MQIVGFEPQSNGDNIRKIPLFFLFWEIFRGTLRAAFALLGGERDTFLMDLSGSSDLGDPLAFDDLHAPFQDVAFFESEERSDAFGNPLNAHPKRIKPPKNQNNSNDYSWQKQCRFHVSKPNSHFYAPANSNDYKI